MEKLQTRVNDKTNCKHCSSLKILHKDLRPDFDVSLWQQCNFKQWLKLTCTMELNAKIRFYCYFFCCDCSKHKLIGSWFHIHCQVQCLSLKVSVWLRFRTRARREIEFLVQRRPVSCISVLSIFLFRCSWSTAGNTWYCNVSSISDRFKKKSFQLARV